MSISEILREYYWLHDSVITGWNWAASNRLVLEIEVNMNQEDDTEGDDFREIILIFEGCTLVDELNEGFNGFSTGDAGIFNADEVKESTSPTARKGIELAMDYNNYDGKGEEFVLIKVFADKVSVIDAHKKYRDPKTNDGVKSYKGKPNNPSWRERDHWHRHNPNKTGKDDAMLDKNGNPVPKYSKASYIEPSP
ncbi:MAG: hypothetical protein LGR52_04420 [Candidatus Thiosymbion ectosymbiont of Robbea hypermnestra]|nr:hypothetical protein [Candidatus Thiosymbion ectosymbiont of Robbea hypermnestra]